MENLSNYNTTGSTMSSQITPEGIPIIIPNVVNDRGDYYISFNSSSREYGCMTTAFVVGNSEAFYILNGDHRSGYSVCKTFDECMSYFKNNIDKIARYSEIPEDTEDV